MLPTPTVSPSIRRLCGLVRVVGVVLLATVFGLYLLTWLFPDLALWDQHWGKVARVGGLPTKAAGQFTGIDRFTIGAVFLPYLFCLGWAFLHLHRMLAGFERGEFFARATVAHLRGFAGFLLIAKALALVAVHIRVAMYLPIAGKVPFAFNVTSDELALLLMCALIFLIAHLMEEGGRLAEENATFL